MLDTPYALALTAGLLAAVNPCGFALLPAYLSLLVVGDDGPGPGGPGSTGPDRTGPDSARADVGGPDIGAAVGSRLAAVRRAVVLTVAMTLGFVAVFGVFGLLAAPAAETVSRNLPWVSVMIGLVLTALGGWLLAGREVPALRIRTGRGPAVTRRFGSMVAFGASYAVASLGCTIGPFLALVVSAFRPGSAAAGIGLFLAYAAGMALVVGTVALSVALAKVSFVRGLRRAGPVITRVGGALLVVAGLYVAWYGWYELRVFRGSEASDPVVDTGARVQAAISTWVRDRGPGRLALVVALLLVAAVTVAVVRNRRRTSATTGQAGDGGH